LIEVKIKPWKQMFVYKMFPQVGDIQNNRKHLIDEISGPAASLVSLQWQ